jgi:hypothetical protein
MKRALIFLSLVLLPLISQGQMILNSRSNYVQVVVVVPPAGGAPEFLTTDGYTMGWYIATSANITLDGSVITNWSDESGSSNDLVNAIGTDRPTWDSGNEEVDFDGVDDIIVDDAFVYSSPIVVYMVINIHQISRTVFRLANFGGGLVTTDVTNKYNIAFGGVSFGGTDNEIVVDTYNIVRFVFNGDVSNGSSIRTNEGTLKVGTLGAASSAYFSLGGKDTDNTGNQSIKEIIIRTTIDDSTNNQSILDYLNTKYSVY